MKNNETTNSNQRWEELKMKITPGDTISSKFGILSESPLTGKFYKWHRAVYRGGGLWEVSDKEEVNIVCKNDQIDNCED